MLKTTLIAAAALFSLALGASQAEAHSYGYGYGHGYGHGSHRYSSYHRPRCATLTRPVSIRVWDDYSYAYIYKTVLRDYTVCS